MNRKSLLPDERKVTFLLAGQKVDSSSRFGFGAAQMASPATLLFPPIVRGDPIGRDRARVVGLGLAFAAVMIVLLVLAIVAPENHDEAQYAATAALAADGVPFRDFMSLQPPVHALVYAPIATLFGDGAFLAMRLATALSAGLVLAVVYAAQRRLGVTVVSAALATFALAGCAAFQFTAGIVRNDMLGALFMAAALAAMIRPEATRNTALRWGVAGALLGLAVATKLSYVPALIAPLFVIRRDAAMLRPYIIGAALGLAPLLILFLIAPAQAWYGLVEFGARAPFHWYAANGRAGDTGVFAKLAGTARSLARGPALPALGLIAFVPLRLPHRNSRLLTAMLIAGLLGALLPTPTHLPYLLPLLPPLFVMAGAAIDGLRGDWRLLTLAALVLFAVIGSTRTARIVAAGPSERSATAIDGQDRWMRDTLRSAHVTGRLVTLSPHRALGSGLALDPRFATGPFVYRSGSLLTSNRAAALNVVTPRDLARELDSQPPAAILTGYERQSRKFAIDPDRGLVAYATARDYRAVALPDGVGTLYLRPR